MNRNGNVDDPIEKVINLQLGNQWERIIQRVMRISPKTKFSDLFPRQGEPNEKDLLSGKPTRDKPVFVFYGALGESELGSIGGEGEFVKARYFYNPRDPSNAKIYDSEHYDQEFLKRLVPEVSRLHRLIPAEEETGGSWWKLSRGSLKEEAKPRYRTRVQKHDWLENAIIRALDEKYHPLSDKKVPVDINKGEVVTEIDLTKRETDVVTLLHHGLRRNDVSKLLEKSRHSIDQTIYRLKKKGFKV